MKPITVALSLVAIILSVFFILFWREFVPRPGAPLTDFRIYYTAGRAKRLYGVESQRAVQNVFHPGAVLPFNHAPFFVPLLRLLCDEDYYASYFRWLAVALLGVVACAFVSYHLLDENRLLGAALVMLFYPLQLSLLGAHDTAFILLGVLVWLWGLTKGREVLAGVALALTTIKPQFALALALPMFFHYRRAWWSFCVACAVLTVYSLLLVGLEGVGDFYQMLRITAAGEGYGIYQNVMYNLTGLLIRSGIGPQTTHKIAWVAYVAALVALCVWWRPTRSLVGVALIASVFFSPHLHSHDLSLLIVPLLCLSSKRVEALVLTSVLLLVSGVTEPVRYVVPYAVMLALSLLLVRQLIKPRSFQP